jgi:hypothetical protein
MITLRSLFNSTVLLSAALVFAGCTASGRSEQPQATRLRAAALSFRLKPPFDRCREAWNLLPALPTCPILHEQDIGTGTLVSFDYSRPSFLLSEADAVNLLGEPASKQSTTWSYSAKEGVDGTTFLWIKFYDGYAVEARLYTIPK